ncbi:hypothetical protein DFP73DRAFT_234462 [Morchella snyderi]|nr:hypothetical protein DFP73DRAFT_234462 [Morchella snyderi]
MPPTKSPPLTPRHELTESRSTIMAAREENEYIWLSPEVIANIEKELNPGGIPFPPPTSWSCPQLDAALKKAYKKKFPLAKHEPQYKGRAQDIAARELNIILEERLRKRPMSNIPIDSWKEARPIDEPFNPALVGNINVGRSPPAPHKKHNSSPATTQPTLPSQSQFTAASSSTSVSTGRGTGTLNGNNGGPLLQQSNTSSPGPSPGRGAVSVSGSFRSRRGRGPGHRSGQLRAGTHLCPHEGCGKSFQYPSKLKDHEHTHLPAKDYACRLGSCTKSFKRMRELKAHEKIIHPGHPSELESESRDQEMVDVSEVELVENQKQPPGRRDEDSKVEIESEYKKETPSLNLYMPSNKTSEAEVASPTSSPHTPNGRGTATPGPEPEQPPPPEPKQPPPPKPKQFTPSERPPQPPVRPPPPDPSPTDTNPTLPVMPDDTGLSNSKKSLSPPPTGSAQPPQEIDSAAQMEKLEKSILSTLRNDKINFFSCKLPPPPQILNINVVSLFHHFSVVFFILSIVYFRRFVSHNESSFLSAHKFEIMT